MSLFKKRMSSQKESSSSEFIKKTSYLHSLPAVSVQHSTIAIPAELQLIHETARNELKEIIREVIREELKEEITC